MVEIIPALIPGSLADIRKKGELVRGVSPVVQIDICDGIFVPSSSWPYITGGPQEYRKMIEGEMELPLWEDISYEIDLMVKNPESVISDWITLGARRIIVHFESTKDLNGIIQTLERREVECPEYGGIAPVEFGVALEIDTPLEALIRCNHRVDFVQLMGIAKIGYQGEPFDERVIQKIANLRHEYPHLIISVDGGVTMETAPRLIAAGATRLVSGSAIFGSSDPSKAIALLSQL